ncbi:hypothetical protein C0992_001432 [Termitomyces sp. T32_za158]|nr:hypothetical protein C0992_001432 [Termitomyces sp. T32_za158]
MSAPPPLPIIDISPFLTPNPTDAVQAQRASTAAALHSACIEYGFFYLDISTYVSPALPAHLAELGRAFFRLPQTEKDQLALKNEDGARGYARLRENVTNGKADCHEGIDFYKPVANPDRTRPLGGENRWPAMRGFREAYEEWIAKMEVLGMAVMQAYAAVLLRRGVLTRDLMAQGLGMTREEWGELRTKVDDSFWGMRVIGYPPLPTDDDGFSCGAHNIPFFFEPNFDADIRPLDAALRLQKPEDRKEQRKPVVYGEFLLKKVGSNFADGKGKYD